MSNWINIRHKKPNIGDRVLIFLHDDFDPKIQIAEYLGFNDWRIESDINDYISTIIKNYVRFWQPLPPNPNTTKDEILVIETLKSIAENPCLCSMGCPRCDALDTLNEMGISL